MGARNKNIDIETAVKLATSQGNVTYDEIRQNLKKWDITVYNNNNKYVII